MDVRRFILAFFLMYGAFCFAFNIDVKVKEKALNVLLLEWQNDYQISFSFDDRLLSEYYVTVDGEYPDIESALFALIKGLPLAYEKRAGVYIIYPENSVSEPVLYRLSAKLIDQNTGEPLAFSVVATGDQYTTTDVRGVFSFTQMGDSLFRIQASHLGCLPLDTILFSGQHQLGMLPYAHDLKQLDVVRYLSHDAIRLAYKPGEMNLNQYIADYLPGNGDNSVFNMLKMQPGILASGELSNDIIIWGSYEGTSKVTYDGFTIWGLNNFNENISTVNPFVVKDVVVQKGGFGAENQDVVGGIVAINGKAGATRDPSASLFVNNQTMNGIIELPFAKGWSLMSAYRQSYRTILSADDILRPQVKNNDISDLTVSDPDYLFQDINAKLSYQGDDGSMFYASFMRGNDDFEMTSLTSFTRNSLEYTLAEKNVQTGASFYYGKTHQKGNQTEVQLFASSLDASYSRYQKTIKNRFGTEIVRKDDEVLNTVEERGVRLKEKWTYNTQHHFVATAELLQNTITLDEDTMGADYLVSKDLGERLSVSLQDEFSFNNEVQLTAGLRYNYAFYLSKSYFDPRVHLSLPLSKYLKANLSWGKYHQFLLKSSVVDDDENYRFRWVLADNDALPVLSSSHYVAELVYQRNAWQLVSSVYYKTYDGISRFVRTKKREQVYFGDAFSRGIDLYAQKEFLGHNIWCSYSLAESRENFPFYTEDDYRRAFQDQRHELKTGALFHIKRFYFSANYVYGSGFPRYDSQSRTYNEDPYKRFDLAINYHLPIDFVTVEMGWSILNVFDADNVKYSQFERVPNSQTSTVSFVNEALPFTSLFYLKVKL